MKNKDIHQKFSDSHVRDFLARELERNWKDTGGRSIRILEEEISALQEKLEFAKRVEAVKNLVESRGWVDWDVTDDVEDWNPETYFPFLGTESEYEILISN